MTGFCVRSAIESECLPTALPTEVRGHGHNNYCIFTSIKILLVMQKNSVFPVTKERWENIFSYLEDWLRENMFFIHFI